MAVQNLQFELNQATLDIPILHGYGLVRGVGNLEAQYEIPSNKKRVAIFLHGEGPWKSMERCWINRKAVTLPHSGIHFHPGGDGEIGSGMAASSTGGDQKVDAFFADFPGGTDFTTFSRLCYTAVKWDPDPGAPSAELEFLADFKALMVRQFDNAGAQTAFDWTQNWVWCALDRIIRAFILREQKLRHDWAQPLTALQLARFDWPLIKAAADYADADIGGGVKRFSDGGLVFLREETLDRAIEQLLLVCRSFITEFDGKIAIREKKDEASSFTFFLDDIMPGSFQRLEAEDAEFNQVLPAFQDVNLASGSSDNATRFAIATSEPLNHEAHQLYSGFSARGVERIPAVRPLRLDFGANTPERVWRVSRSFLLERLGDEPDPGVVYRAPALFELAGLEHTVKVMPGDVVTLDAGISEEWGGLKFRVRSVEERPDGTRRFQLKQHNSNAYPDTAPAQQGTQAPNPGTGLAPSAGAGNLSYRTLKNVLRAIDAGSDATIEIEDPDTGSDFTNRVTGYGDLVVTAGTKTVLNYETLYHSWYEDFGNPPTGGAKAFFVSTVKADGLGLGKFYLGSILTPKAGAPPTRGNNDSGATAQTGSGIYTKPNAVQSTASGWTNQGNAGDTDLTTFASYNQQTTIETSLEARGFPVWPSSAGFVRLEVSHEITTAFSAGSVVVERSFNGGGSWSTIASYPAPGLGRHEDSYVLSLAEIATVQGGLLWLRVRVLSSGGAATGAGRVYEFRVRVED